MLRNYLAAAFRNLARNRLYAVINIIGLGIGLAGALLSLLYVRHETTHDRFIPGAERVYVMTYYQALKGGSRIGIGDRTPAHFAQWLEEDFPGVRATRLMPSEWSVRRGDVETLEQVGWADPDFFALLPLPTVAGELSSALSTPDAVVITRGMARKYFGHEAPIGELLEVGRKEFLRVVAVIEDLPAATHLAPEIYGSTRNRTFGLLTIDEAPYQMSGSTPVLTYATVPEGGLAIEALQSAMPEFVRTRMRELLSKIEASLVVQLVAVPALHLSPNNMQAMKPHADPKIVYAIGFAGLLIVGVAVINFINLTSARVLRRATEAGIRKVSGAQGRDLRIQFMGEAMGYAMLALLLGLLLADRTVPALDALVPGVAEQWHTMPMLVAAIGLAIVAGVLGGLYPAYLVSTIRPAAVLKRTNMQSSRSAGRQVLVGLQFAVLIVLIFSTLAIYRQTVFSLRDGLRFSGDGMLLVYARCDANLAAALRAVNGVRGVACSDRDPFNIPHARTQGRRDDGSTITFGIGGVGFGYFELYGITPLAGRLYDEVRDMEIAKDGRAPLAIINESAVRVLGFASATEAVGRSVSTIQNQDGPPSQIIGVVPDYTFDTREFVMPTVYWPALGTNPLYSVLNVRLSGENVGVTLDAIDAVWQRHGDARPIHRVFLDRAVEAHHANIGRQQTLIGAAAFAATLIACFGLFGLAALSAEQRTKEIGIRKSMGADRRSVLTLILWQFVRPVLWSNVLAWPLAYFVMRTWLDGFAYRISLAPWMFIAASGLALLIALITVIGHTLGVVRAHPVAALRYE